MEINEGWGSKKLAFGLICAALIFVGWAMTHEWALLQANYTILVGGLTGIYALFIGGNVGNKIVAGKHLVQMAAVAGDTDGDGVPDEEPAEEKKEC
jgi:hypothetical protein